MLARLALCLVCSLALCSGPARAGGHLFQRRAAAQVNVKVNAIPARDVVRYREVERVREVPVRTVPVRDVPVCNHVGASLDVGRTVYREPARFFVPQRAPSYSLAPSFAPSYGTCGGASASFGFYPSRSFDVPRYAYEAPRAFAAPQYMPPVRDAPTDVCPPCPQPAAAQQQTTTTTTTVTTVTNVVR